jgi:hypothetical protein
MPHRARIATQQVRSCFSRFPTICSSIAERIHVSPGNGVGVIRIRIWRLGPVIISGSKLSESQKSNPIPKEQPVKILALDLGKFNTMCCFFDTKTRKHSFLNATTERRYLDTIFKQHKIDLVVMEACGPSGWINDLAKSHHLPTLVCSTNEDAWNTCGPTSNARPTKTMHSSWLGWLP